MLVTDLPGLPGLGLRLLAGGDLGRPVRRVFTTDLPDPGRYLSGGELVLTGLIWYRGPGDADRFTAALARAGAAALAAGEALGPVPAELARCCGRLGLPLFAVPAETSFAAVTDEVMRRLSGDRAGAMTRALGRQRRLLSAVTAGAGLDALFALAGRELATGCWLVTGTGRLVAGTGGARGSALPAGVALRLAREYLAAAARPATVRVRGQDYTLLPASRPAGLTGWFLACAGIAGSDADEALEPVTELAADIALERARLDAGRRGERRLGQQIVTALVSEGDSAEVAALMRAAELPPDGCYLAAAVRGEPEGNLADLVEELVRPDAGRAVTGLDADEVLALVPVDPAAHPAAHPAAADASQSAAGARGGGRGLRGGAGSADGASVTESNYESFGAGDTDGADSDDDDAAGGGYGARGAGGRCTAARALAARIREAQPALAAGLRGGRLSVGISDAVAGPGGLAGALREARSARRLAELRPGPVCVVTGDEGGTHAMLLASVPPGVLSSFRGRLLGPLLRYDRRRGAELVPTLSAFLACSGSWNACAARLHVHVNTLRYRIRRIEELTGRDLSSLGDQVDFFLALNADQGSGAAGE